MSLQHVTGINHFLRTGRVIRPRVGATNRFVFTGEFLCIFASTTGFVTSRRRTISDHFKCVHATYRGNKSRRGDKD